jgi:ribosomal protein S18 acetylase RimI-like enzyme
MRAFWEASTAETTTTPYPGAPFEESLLTEHLSLVAEDGGTPVGCVYANISAEAFGFVFGLYVRPDRQRQGVARALMRAIAAEIAGGGRIYVVLSVDTPNTAARSLYERLGFFDAARTLRADAASLLDEP